MLVCQPLYTDCVLNKYRLTAKGTNDKAFLRNVINRHIVRLHNRLNTTMTRHGENILGQIIKMIFSLR